MLNKYYYINIYMTKYNFQNFEYDNLVTHYHYLPYLDDIPKQYIDQFNLIILRNKYGYYVDENSPKNYLSDNKRYINDKDRMMNYRSKYDYNNLLYKNLTRYLNSSIIYYNKDLKDYNRQREYEGYLHKVQSHIYLENKRLMKIIEELDLILIDNPLNLSDNRTKKVNFNLLLVILIVIIIISIFTYNITYIK